MNTACIETDAVIISREGALGDIDTGKAADTFQLYETHNGICCFSYRSELVLDRSTIILAIQKKALHSNRAE